MLPNSDSPPFTRSPMEDFTEEHSQSLLRKEWLVKIDGQESKPYLIKFYASMTDMSCYIMLTDTKSVWSEVLSGNQFARRWRACNNSDAECQSEASEGEKEHEWRSQRLQLLSKAHSLGGITDLSFQVNASRYSDVAFELESESFKWRWEAMRLPPKMSAELISKHVIIPLISINHLSFASADPVGELSEKDLEKAVDKIGRTARRSLDTHVKQALSKPRVATTLQRMTTLLNFIPDLAPITFEIEKPDMNLPPPSNSPAKPRAQPSPPEEPVLMQGMPSSSPCDMIVDLPPRFSPSRDVPADASGVASPQKHQVHMDGSTTESSGDEDPRPAVTIQVKEEASRDSQTSDFLKKKSPSPAPSPAQIARGSGSSDESGPPVKRPPAKKAKAALASPSDDSDDERQQRPKSGTGAKRGTRQPVKRGGKRF